MFAIYKHTKDMAWFCRDGIGAVIFLGFLFCILPYKTLPVRNPTIRPRFPSIHAAGGLYEENSKLHEMI